MAKKTVCSIDGCGKAHQAKGLCAMHYQRLRLRGDVNWLPDPSQTNQAFDKVCIHRGEECLLWEKFGFSGGFAHGFIDGKFRSITRYVCEKVYGPSPGPEYQAAHSCGMAHIGCVNASHLRWATRKENEADKLTHGTSQRGFSSGLAVLTEEDVRRIKTMIADGFQNKEIAEKYSVDGSTISNIKTGKNWSWVTEHEGSRIDGRKRHSNRS